MGKLFDLFIPEETRHEERRQEANSLDRFVGQFYQEKRLWSWEAKENVGRGLLEITNGFFGHHTSNGLLITEDGYFVTPYHCLSNDIKNRYLILHNNTIHEIQRVCAVSKPYDLALAKAYIQGASEPIRYKFLDVFRENTFPIPINLLTRWKGVIMPKDGVVTGITTHYDITRRNGYGGLYQDQFLLDIPLIPGDSGGVFIDERGRILGMANSFMGDFGIGYGSKWVQTLELIDAYKRSLQLD